MPSAGKPVGRSPAASPPLYSLVLAKSADRGSAFEILRALGSEVKALVVSMIGNYAIVGGQGYTVQFNYQISTTLKVVT